MYNLNLFLSNKSSPFIESSAFIYLLLSLILFISLCLFTYFTYFIFKSRIEKRNLLVLNNIISELIIYNLSGKYEFLGNFKLKHQFGTDFLVNPIAMRHRFVHFEDVDIFQDLEKKSSSSHENYSHEFLVYDLSNREISLHVRKIFLNRRGDYLMIFKDVTASSNYSSEADIRLKKLELIERFLSSDFTSRIEEISFMLSSFSQISLFENAVFYDYDKKSNQLHLVSATNLSDVKEGINKFFNLDHFFYLKNTISNNSFFIKNDQYFLTGMNFPGLSEEKKIKNSLVLPYFTEDKTSLVFFYNFKIFPNREKIDVHYSFFRIFMLIIDQRIIRQNVKVRQNSLEFIHSLADKSLPSKSPVAKEIPEGRRDILLVEDNYINQQVILELLKNEGYRVIIAESGFKALEILANENNIGLIFMDLHMPEMNGIETTRKILELENFSKVPIVAMTADSLDSARREALSVGMSDYITKPVDVKKLLEVINIYNKE
ncbi:MAG: response regulator [Spirochaetales bacterium]|nr:response regulator [Spirochaetales bacterium]